jgi:hypothetical protein
VCGVVLLFVFWWGKLKIRDIFLSHQIGVAEIGPSRDKLLQKLLVLILLDRLVKRKVHQHHQRDCKQNVSIEIFHTAKNARPLYLLAMSSTQATNEPGNGTNHPVISKYCQKRINKIVSKIIRDGGYEIAHTDDAINQPKRWVPVDESQRKQVEQQVTAIALLVGYTFEQSVTELLKMPHVKLAAVKPNIKYQTPATAYPGVKPDDFKE